MTGGHAAVTRRRRLLALVAFRDEMRFLPGLIENLAPHVDGIVALDDQSEDESAAFMAAQPLVLELLTVPRGAQEELEDGLNHRALTQASWHHQPDWLLGIDADERVERDFRARAEAEIERAETLGHRAMWVPFRELWNDPSTYRADGIWGEKRKACLFKASRDHVFDMKRVHALWASLPVPDGDWPTADLELYHLRMLDPQDRPGRHARYGRIDPDHVWQPIGYDYLLDDDRLRAAGVEPGRGFTPPAEEVAGAPERRLLISPTLDFGGMELQMIELARALGRRGGRSSTTSPATGRSRPPPGRSPTSS